MIISWASSTFRSRARLTWLKYFLSCEIKSLPTWKSECLQYCSLMSRSYMTFTLRSQAFCFFIFITIICHEISHFSVCPYQVVLCEGICIAYNALLLNVVYCFTYKCFSFSNFVTKDLISIFISSPKQEMLGELLWSVSVRHHLCSINNLL